MDILRKYWVYYNKYTSNDEDNDSIISDFIGR